MIDLGKLESRCVNRTPGTAFDTYGIGVDPETVLALVRAVRAALAVREGPGGSVTGNGGRVFALAEVGAFNAMCEALAPFRGPPEQG